MPLYDVSCPVCAQKCEVFRSLSQHGQWPVCACGEPMQQVPTAPTIHNREIYDYTSTLDGERITSSHQHHEHMRKHNVFEVGNEIAALTERKPEAMPDMRREMAETYDRVEAMQRRGEI